MRHLSNYFKASLLFKSSFQVSRIPIFSSSSAPTTNNQIHIIQSQQAASLLPKHKVKEFQESKQTKIITIDEQSQEKTEKILEVYNEKSWKKIKEISKDTFLQFSEEITKQNNFVGIASEILTKAYKFSRKQKPEKDVTIGLNTPENQYIFQLSRSKIQAAEWANSRANEATTAFMLAEAQKIVAKHPGLKLTTIKGDDLLKEKFRLMHAVGRASNNQPVFICIEWKGKPESDQFVGLVGKGVTFDAGGLNLKPSTAISGMHNDKHGACSVLSAIDSVATLNLKSNVVAVLGLVQNFVSSNSYRPLDIIESRKGLTVQIGNTDAEGRLVLADCMNWIQQKYKLTAMLELSTLTGAITIALGKERAGLFTNSQKLVKEIIQAGEEVQELGWHMPIDQYHEQLIKSKQADITNASKQPEGSSCQAAAFLKNFVEPGVEWAHIDIAAVSESGTFSTGYGAKLLLHFLKKRAG